MGPVGLLVVVTLFAAGCLVEAKLKPVHDCGYKGLVSGVVAEEKRDSDGVPDEWPGYPWIVTLQSNWHDKGKFKDICTVSVINRYWFLTAAHCFAHSNDTSKYVIHAGERKVASKYVFHAKSYTVKKIIIHEGYNPHDLSNDIALIRTVQRLHIDRGVGFLNGICLPHKHQKLHSPALIRGWEHARNGETGVAVPHEIEVPLVSPEKCAILYGKERMPHSVLCAGDVSKATCQSDSGSPLMHRDSKGKYTIIGIVSYGIGCGGMLPGIYTKVSAYIDWMDHHVLQYGKHGKKHHSSHHSSHHSHHHSYHHKAWWDK